MAPLNETCPRLAKRAAAPLRADDVRPDEIGIVMAMGDSMTAGFNVKDGAVMSEYRGWGFSSGVEPTANTLGTFLKAYNPQLIGGAKGSREPSQKVGQYANVCPETDWDICGLNAAVDGARLGWLDRQADWLEMRLESLAPGTWKDQWKILTILSGMDDIVFGPTSNATKHPPTDVSVVEEQLNDLLAALHDRFPKLLVNILALPDLLQANVTVSTFQCRAFKEITVLAGIHWTDLELWHPAVVQYNEMLVRTVKRWQGQTCNSATCSMAVALRYPLYKTDVDSSALDTSDCFHPNLRLAEGMAIGIWNEMLEGIPSQPLGIHWQRPARCLEPQHRFTIPEPVLQRRPTEVMV